MTVANLELFRTYRLLFSDQYDWLFTETEIFMYSANLVTN